MVSTLFRPLARRLGRQLAKQELMPLVVALFENVCHLDWDNEPSAISEDGGKNVVTESPSGVKLTNRGASTLAQGNSQQRGNEIDSDSVTEDSDTESLDLPSPADSQHRARESRRKLLIALVHTDMQLAFCTSFGPLEYIRVIFPYLEDSLYVFPSAPPSEGGTPPAAASTGSKGARSGVYLSFCFVLACLCEKCMGRVDRISSYHNLMFR